MNNPNDLERLPKLPQWAREHIEDLTRQRNEAVRQLNTLTDAQTPSPMFVDDFVGTGEQSGPVVKRRYFLGRQITIKWKGAWLRVFLAENDHQRETGICLTWGGGDGHLSSDQVAFIPTGYQSAAIVSRDNMKLR